jgi:hypothetical protein
VRVRGAVGDGFPWTFYFGLVCFGARVVILGGGRGAFTFTGLDCVGRVLRLCWWEGDGGANVCRGCRATMAGRTWFTTAVPLVWSKSLGWFDRGILEGFRATTTRCPLPLLHLAILPAYLPIGLPHPSSLP